MTLRILPGLVLAVLLQLLPVMAASAYEVTAPGRVVAFGDVHGAFDDWVTLLQEVGVINADLDWAGGNTHLVSLGDLIDRGPGSRSVVALMMKLEAQAEAAGGAVHMVLGNHEVLVMTGDLRYVSDEEYADFAALESQGEREAAFAAWRLSNPDGDDQAARQGFDTDYPPGYFALRRTYAGDGEFGRWLRQQPFVIKVNDKVYMHGGIAYDLIGESLDEINERMGGELQAYLDNQATLRTAGALPWHADYDDQLGILNVAAEQFVAANPDVRAEWFDAMIGLFDAQQASLFSPNAPNWYRGSAFCHPYAESFNTESFLKRAGARQLVIGHTPSRGQVIDRMEGQVIRLDTGMLKSVYGGRAAALVSGDGNDYVHYLASDEKAQPVVEGRSLAMGSAGMSDAELEDFMRSSQVVVDDASDNSAATAIRVQQSLGQKSNAAVFMTKDDAPGLENASSYRRSANRAERYVYDVAAYKLDRLLDLQLVPTAVLATVQGDAGALVDIPGKVMTEQERLDGQVPFSGYCAQGDQYRLRNVFDVLVYNEGRVPANTLWSRDRFMLRLTGHSNAFRTDTKRPRAYSKAELEVSDLLYAKLQSLARSALDEELGAYLHPRQIEAVLKRRDRILKEAKRSGG